MAEPTVLERPPITEALVDFRAAVDQPPDVFERFAQELRAEFAETQVLRGVKAELRIQQGKLIPPSAEDLGFQGIRVWNRDRTLVAQFRPDGFTLNNLTRYVGGDRLIGEALRLWEMWTERAGPVVVSRVALRYLSQLALPIRDGDDFGKYLTAAPDLPTGAPQAVSEFLTRVVAHDVTADVAVVVTQRWQPRPQVGPVLHVDVDAFKTGEFPVAPGPLRHILDTLRIVKNRTFFSLLTEETVGLYK